MISASRHKVKVFLLFYVLQLEIKNISELLNTSGEYLLSQFYGIYPSVSPIVHEWIEKCVNLKIPNL